MIHKQICTYEVCRLAKKKGFDVDCEAFYYNDGNLQYAKFENWNGHYLNKFSAPTQSLLQRWLREEKGIIVEVIAQPTCSTSKKNCYWWSVKQNSDGFCYQYEECSYLLYSD